jgi:hypothetical protein
MNSVYVVEIIRYGDDAQGIHMFGAFTDIDVLHNTMIEYNNFRGGKYPEYYVTELRVDQSDTAFPTRVRYKVPTTA